MAHIIGDIAVMPRAAKRTQNLSCLNEIKRVSCKKDIYNTDAIQQKINEAAKEKARIEAENKNKFENIKHINLLG